MPPSTHRLPPSQGEARLPGSEVLRLEGGWQAATGGFGSRLGPCPARPQETPSRKIETHIPGPPFGSFPIGGLPRTRRCCCGGGDPLKPFRTMAKAPDDPQPGPSDDSSEWEPDVLQSEIIKTPVEGLRGQLRDAFADLGESELQRFKWKLQRFLDSDGVPGWWVQDADAPKLAGLLLHFRPGDAAAAGLAIELLERSGCQEQAEKLRKATGKGKRRWKKNDDELEEFFKCPQCPNEDLAIKIQPELVLDCEKGYDLYRLNCTDAGSFRCCVTDLIFDVNAPVTLTYYFDSWFKNLNEDRKEQWEIAGPLLNIQADPEEAVASIHFPHFLCLEGKGCSEIYLVHFGEKGMSLEKPDSVGPYHVESKNLTSCPCGAVLKKSQFERKIKAHAVALLYQKRRAIFPELHFYLLPNDSSLKKAVHDHELEYHKVRNLPQIMQPLTIGSHFILKSTPGSTVFPEKLRFNYPTIDGSIRYLELETEYMVEVLVLVLLEDDTNDLVWNAFIQKEELMHAAFHPIIEQQRFEKAEESKKFLKCKFCPMWNFAVNIQPETVLDPQKGFNVYRLNCIKAGSFCCCITDLIFDVTAPVTLTYYFDSWSKYLNEEHKKQWDIAGPLLNIQADAKEAVAAVHFPHFLCLKGKDYPEIYLAHFVEDGMSLEKPDSVGPYHMKLKNPAFSPRGAVFKRSWFKRRIKVHAVALLYQDLGVQSMKLHFYLVPNDSSLRKAVHDLELNYASQRVWKPPETMKALKIGSCFSLQKMTDVTVCPEYLEFKYLPADMEQQYLELHSKAMKDELSIFLTEKDTDELVWRAIMRKEDLHSTVSPPIEGGRRHPEALMPSVSSTSGRNGNHFIDRYREELIQRTPIDQVLDCLYGTVLTAEQYENIRTKETNQEKMRELYYKIMPSWNNYCKDRLYAALKDTNPYLIEDLEGK